MMTYPAIPIVVITLLANVLQAQSTFFDKLEFEIKASKEFDYQIDHEVFINEIKGHNVTVAISNLWQLSKSSRGTIGIVYTHSAIVHSSEELHFAPGVSVCVESVLNIHGVGISSGYYGRITEGMEVGLKGYFLRNFVSTNPYFRDHQTNSLVPYRDDYKIRKWNINLSAQVRFRLLSTSAVQIFGSPFISTNLLPDTLAIFDTRVHRSTVGVSLQIIID